MVKKRKNYLRVSADKRPYFGPWNDVYLTDIEKASTRQALKEATKEELDRYYDELDNRDPFTEIDF